MASLTPHLYESFCLVSSTVTGSQCAEIPADQTVRRNVAEGSSKLVMPVACQNYHGTNGYGIMIP